MFAYFPIFLAAGIALHQLYLVESASLSRWKGGGFGMYSEQHPNTREIWGTTAAGESFDIRPYLKSEIEKNHFFASQSNPSDKNLAILLKLVQKGGKDILRIEVFQLVNMKDVLSYQKIRVYNREKF